jgi:pimeloyl-ACP methyl ester carboxylesterase
VDATDNRAVQTIQDHRHGSGGHGESDAPLWAFSLEDYADDVCALLDHLAIPQAVLVGLSMGGYVGFAISRKYGNRLKGLVLADTRAQADSPEGRTGRFNLAQTAYGKGADAVADIMLPNYWAQHHCNRNLNSLITSGAQSGTHR